MQTDTTTSTIKREDLVDIEELETKIAQFKSGEEPEERFRHYRLTRGVYGQRQEGVQMFRTKLPYGKVTTAQLKVLADLAESYGHQNLHITTRQNVQLHYVKLENAPLVWRGLAASGLTARGACGNTVRNVTASATAGIDPNEPFDITPYVHATYEYFLRNPIQEDMGRKIKIAFSAAEDDSGFTYFHDFGFIARVKDGVRGFKVVVGGGLGAISIVAPTVSEFVPAREILPFMEAAIRVFDRYGERQKRQKARMKFLVRSLGVEKFLALVEEEKQGIPKIVIDIDHEETTPELPVGPEEIPSPVNTARYDIWSKSNVFAQKQEGFVGVYVKVHLGDLSPETARALADLTAEVAADDIRFTVDQNLLLRFVRPAYLPYLFNRLDQLGLADGGFGSISDVTACPGTDTCALGVTNSTGLATTLKDLVEKEYPELLTVRDIAIKISGCMNSCGQHMGAAIGFHGSSIKSGFRVIPAMQIVLGGGVDPLTGQGYVADKVIKLPTKRIPEALRVLLADYDTNREDHPNFTSYFRSQGKRYFYDLLKVLGDTEDVAPDLFFDWNQDRQYIQSIGVGECAGVSYDMVGAILGDASNKIAEAKKAYADQYWSGAIYHAYTGMVIGAKAWLLSNDVKCNTHIGIVSDFEATAPDHFTDGYPGTFSEMVFQMKKGEPTQTFATDYLALASRFVDEVIRERAGHIEEEGAEKLVVGSYYKA